MYKTIMITLENSAADQTILDHVRPLARLTGSRFFLVHVADGWVARRFLGLNMAESEEISEDRAYLARRAEELRKEGFAVEVELTGGDPASEIIRLSREKEIDLIAMSTHGHRFLADFFYGNTADKVRHEVSIPVLLLKSR